MSFIARFTHRCAATPSARGLLAFTAILLLIELLDELVFNIQGAAMPRIRDDLGLSYAEVGLLFSIPAIAASLIEPLLGVLGDVWRRKALIVGGGLVIAVALTAIAASRDFVTLLIALVVASPASGAFVTLSQAALMDLNPGRTEQMMARWTVFGSAGYVIGPLMGTLAFAFGFGWRGLYFGLALGAAILAVAVWRQPFNGGRSAGDGEKCGRREVWQAVRDPKLLRWLALVQASDLMLDVLLGFVALYFHDILHVSDSASSAAPVVMAVVRLSGDVLLIPLLERVRGLALLRRSSVVVLGLYLAWLIIGWLPAKYVLLALIVLGTTGWYQVLQGQAYAALPGKSGTVMAAGSLAGLVGSAIPFALGLIAERLGLGAAMWLLAIGPLSLMLFLARE